MQINNLKMSFDEQELFHTDIIQIGEHEKIGLVGVNGAGKTTLFKIILGLIKPDSGKIILKNNNRIGFMPQVIDEEIPNLDMSVFDFMLLGRPIKKLEKELEDTYNDIAKEKSTEKQLALFNKIDKIQDKLSYWESYQAENSLLKIISGMGISSELLDHKLNNISGGQKSKIAFARLLYSKPELILLDEPTNHLDKESKDYVINYLKNYKGSILIISHDIDFLNQVTTKTLYIDKRTKTIELYNGNYDNFKRLNVEYEKTISVLVETQKREEEKLRLIIEKYTNSSGNRKKMAQDREKKLNKLLKEKIIVSTKDKVINFEMPINRASTNIPIKVDNLDFRYDKTSQNNIINKLSFELFKGEKFLVVGRNGIGKSTLLKLLIGELVPDMGIIEIDPKTDIGYYAQQHELLNNDKNIINNFDDIDISINKLRSFLGKFLFIGDDVFKKVGILSPGERSRVALAKLSLKGANLLLLDEPTNHLDPETQKIIADTFSSYKGTMLVVSHNLEFVDNLGIDRILVLPYGKILYYDKETVEYFQTINQSK